MIQQNNNINLIFGLKIRTLRQRKGINYQQLSDMTKIAVSYLHDIENGKKYPKADKILMLAKTLEVDYDYLVSLSGDKKLQPIIDLLNTNFLSAVPWEHFGLTNTALLEIFTNTPDRVTAFISTILKLSRSYQMSRGSFYTLALRSYQDLFDNYFEELENVSIEGIMDKNITNNPTNNIEESQIMPKDITVELLENILQKTYHIEIDREKMALMPELRKLRSFFNKAQKILYLNKNLSNAQAKFLIAREIIFQKFSFQPRPYETVLVDLESFEELLNNFKASYASCALLMPEYSLVEDIRKNLFNHQKWNPEAWKSLLQQYDVTPEMFLQRLTNILPKHFGLSQLFFLRIEGNVAKNEYEITKELHLAQLHDPYAHVGVEHYCRRWISINIMKEATKLQKDEYIIDVQISEYWQTHNRYLCISIAKPNQENDTATSVTIGIMIDAKTSRIINFLNDKDIIFKIVHTTCERCGVENCLQRTKEPIVLQQKEQVELVKRCLSEL